MQHQMRKYSEGSVSPYARTGTSKPKWRATIREGVSNVQTDRLGHPVVAANGTPKLSTKWRALTKVLPNIECTPYKYLGKTAYRGLRETEQALAN